MSIKYQLICKVQNIFGKQWFSKRAIETSSTEIEMNYKSKLNQCFGTTELYLVFSNFSFLPNFGKFSKKTSGS